MIDYHSSCRNQVRALFFLLCKSGLGRLALCLVEKKGGVGGNWRQIKKLLKTRLYKRKGDDDIQEHEEVTSFFSMICFTVMTHLNLGNVFFFIWTKKENGKSKLIESFITFCNSFIEEVFHTQRETERERARKS